MDVTSIKADSFFFGVLGHERVQQQLANALARNQLHHALLLTGPAGVGKATLARGLCYALMCPHKPGQGCGECHHCTRIRSGSHPDLDLLVANETGGAITVEQARESYQRQLAAPYEAKAYVVIIDPADALTESAGNALLKAIEEPRPGVYFFLLAQNLYRILPTLLSRSLPIALGRLRDPQVHQIIGQKFSPPFSEKQTTAVLLAEGSAGLAIELANDPTLEKCFDLLRCAYSCSRQGPSAIFAGDQSSLWQAWQAAVESTAQKQLHTNPSKQKKARRTSSAKPGAKAKESPAHQRAVALRLSDLWILHLRECLHGRPGLPGMGSESPTRTAEQLTQELHLIHQFAASMERNVNVRLAFENTLLKIHQFA